MRPVTGVIQAVGKGEVLVQMSNGIKLKHQTDRDFEYGQKVFVFFDFTKFKIRKLVYEKELDLSDKVEEPEFEPTEDAVLIPGDEEDQEQEGSLPRPDGRFQEFFPECDEEQE